MTLNDRQVDELVQRWRRLVVNQQEGVSYGFWLGSVLLALLISMAVIWSVWRSPPATGPGGPRASQR